MLLNLVACAVLIVVVLPANAVVAVVPIPGNVTLALFAATAQFAATQD